jgi:uncharacterized metal-binding protein YceD (DUF177 family)
MNIFRIEAEQLRTAPVVIDFSEPSSAFDIENEDIYQFLDPIEGAITATIAGTTVVLLGKMSTIVTVPCVRCLEPLRAKMTLDVSLAYMHEVRSLHRRDHDEEKDDDSEYYDGEIVEPAKQLREFLLLELPQFPVCEDNGLPACKPPHVSNPTDEAPKKKAAAAPEPEVEPRNLWKEQLANARAKLDQPGKK